MESILNALESPRESHVNNSNNNGQTMKLLQM
jgi:hypothetical protein